MAPTKILLLFQMQCSPEYSFNSRYKLHINGPKKAIESTIQRLSKNRKTNNVFITQINLKTPIMKRENSHFHQFNARDFINIIYILKQTFT